MGIFFHRWMAVVHLALELVVFTDYECCRLAARI